MALPDGIALYTEAAYALALRRPSGEVVVRRGTLARRRSSPGTLFRWPAACSVALAALAFGHGQSGELTTADVGAQSLATAADGRYLEQRRRSTLMALSVGLVAAPFLFALWPTVACSAVHRVWNLVSSARAMSPAALAWVEGTAALLFVPLYIRLLRLSPGWRRLFRYHAAGHQVRAAVFAGLPLREATARTMHPQQPDCTASVSLVTALFAAGMAHVWESALPAMDAALPTTTMRLVLLLPAWWMASSLRAAWPRGPRVVRRQRQARATAWFARACLPVADEPNDGEREVALCAMVALFSSDAPFARTHHASLAWQRLAGAVTE